MSAPPVDVAERDRRVRALGGNPACLHCQLNLVLNDWASGRPEGPPDALELAMALGGLAGDVVGGYADLTLRSRAIETAIGALAHHAGADVTTLARPKTSSGEKLH